MCMKLALERISSNFLERGLCKGDSFPWSDRCSLGTMILIIFLNDPVIMVSHFIEGRTSTGTETFCPLICLDASQFVLLIGAENQPNYRIQGQFSRYIFVEVAR